MAIGPVQLLVLGFSHPDFHGEVIAELENLRASNTVRVIDALAVYKGRDAMAETQETLRADIEGLYGPLKALSEAEARRQFGERVTIVRPGFIVGPRDETDRFTYWPHRVAQGGEMLVPGDGADPGGPASASVARSRDRRRARGTRDHRCARRLRAHGR